VHLQRIAIAGNTFPLHEARTFRQALGGFHSNQPFADKGNPAMSEPGKVIDRVECATVIIDGDAVNIGQGNPLDLDHRDIRLERQIHIGNVPDS
jgi:hypothetical protein